MGIRIETEHDLKKCSKLAFCYICGRPFQKGDTKNRDHIPPSSLFAKDDRRGPLILPTHSKCNEACSQDDEKIGQLIGVLHGKYPGKDRLRIDFTLGVMEGSSRPLAASTNLALTRIVFRWLRAFHAALYKQFLPSVGGYIHPPMPEGERRGDKARIRPIEPIQIEYVKTIKKNRFAKNTDLVICNNGKCRYECVWARSDDRSMILCIFALDIYGWADLGDIHHFPRRGCVGIYTPDRIPACAAKDTNLEFRFPNKDALDPFGR